jgi:hypothetical protein
MTKKEVCALLGISPKTLGRRMASGRYKFTKAEGQYGKVSFTFADLGLPEPTPAPVPVVAVEAPTPERVPNIREPDAFRPRQNDPTEFRDSFGHTLSGNAEHRLFATQNGPPVDLQIHMQPALLGTSGSRERHSFDRGLSDDDLSKMKSDWRGRRGGLSMSEQREKQERSRTAINAAFPRAQ